MSNDPKSAETKINKQTTRLSKFREGLLGLLGCGCLIIAILGIVSIIESVWGVAANLLGVDRKNTAALFIFLIVAYGVFSAIKGKDKK